jgi:pyruvate/2-oxoglutarate dehydrogenase complex dihydrolipoamide acyltransferase (E2) component
MFQFKVPDIGEGVVEAEVITWRVNEGDTVEEDQILVDLLTDKAEIEIPSPVAGRVHRLHAAVGEIVPVGAVLIEIDDEAAADDRPAAETAAVTQASSPGTQPAPASRPETSTGAAPPPAADSPPPATTPSPPAATPARPAHRPPAMPARPRSQQLASARGGPVEAVPAVRDLAKRLGVELEEVQGTGPGGRIMRRDVERHQAGAETEPVFAPPEQDEPDWERRPLRGLRRAIARRMVQARRTAAHFTYVEEVDMTHLLERMQASGIDVSPLAFIAHATVRTLPQHETLNASIDGAREEIILKRDVHLGIAAATDGGLLVPVVRDAAGLSVTELAQAIETLAGRAREGRLRPAELKGSTFTITSLGKLGGIISTPIVNYPEVAILGVNAIRAVPLFVDGELQERRVMNLSISVDHRIADGVVAAEFIRDLKAILESADFSELSRREET